MPTENNATAAAGQSLFDGREFRNLDGVPAGRSLLDLLRWKILGDGKVAWPQPIETGFVAPALPAHVGPGEAAATFVGHSTWLLQFAGGLNVLTDPVWSERASPVAFAGPRRARRAGLAFEDLPPIRVVLVSHGHYDHLDLSTLRRLDERCEPLFVAGLGQEKFLRRKGLKSVVELDWWQARTVEGLEITFTPAQHWTARSFARRNTTLWGGFWLRQGGGPTVFFAGDTGLGAHFALIRERLGAPDLALLPIGAYAPRWFMRDQHMDPNDAVQAHLALAARRSLGMHFGTFQLTDEGVDEPAERLAASLRGRGVEAADLRVPRFGETFLAGRGEP